jgi:hypothetical protein
MNEKKIAIHMCVALALCNNHDGDDEKKKPTPKQCISNPFAIIKEDIPYAKTTIC